MRSAYFPRNEGKLRQPCEIQGKLSALGPRALWRAGGRSAPLRQTENRTSDKPYPFEMGPMQGRKNKREAVMRIKRFLSFTVCVIVSLAASARAEEKCTRNCLEEFAHGYLDALIAQNPSEANLAPSAKSTENQRIITFGEGLWTKARRLGDYQIFASDIRNQQIAFLGNIETTDGWSMLAVRLKIRDNQIAEVETIYPGPAAANGTFDLGAGAGSLGKSRPALSKPLSKSERRDRWQLIQAADLHYEGIERGNGDIVPFGEKCIKIENGVQLIKNPDFPFPAASPSGAYLPNFAAMGCQEQFNTHVWDTDLITDRRYPVVDEERGVVVAFAMYHQYIKAPCADVVDYGAVCPAQPTKPYSLAMAEAFRVRDGFIEEVEAVFTVLPEVKLRGVW